MGRPRGILLGALLLLLPACNGAEAPSPGGTPSPTPSPPSPRAGEPTTPSPPTMLPLDEVDFGVRRVAVIDGGPLAMAVRDGDPSLYIATKRGLVVSLRDGRVAPDAVLDLSSEVSDGFEQGLLGLAFSPGGRFVYVNFTDRQGDTQVVEFAMDGRRIDPGSRRSVLTVDQPFSNHNGGNLVFGPDGHLYIGLGDGGSGGDPMDNAQNLGTLLGKMLRIAPRPAGGRPYGVPEGNPFAGHKGARREIWAYGLRNPWRYSFDRETGDLWIGDVGQNRREEIDFQPADSEGGENYGWNRVEGNLPFAGSAPPGAREPILDYPLEDGACAVTGGYVYRGARIRGLYGTYLFADFCVGRITGLRQEGGRVTEHRAFEAVVPNLASFGEDARGELYALSLEGGVYRLVPP